MNYIIFGGSGFVGTHLAKVIRESGKDCKIYSLDILKPGEPIPNISHYRTALCEGEAYVSEYIPCDVRKPIEVTFEPTPDDVIFNLAAVHRTPGHEDVEYFETNIRGAENVCAFADRYGIKRIVFTSSIAPYGAAEELKFESTLPTPNTPYGISKLVAEKIHMVWKAKSSDRQLVILRPGVVFGKGENGNFTRLYWGVRKRTFAYPGRKDTIKACVYVKELVRFMLWRLDNYKDNGTPESDIYNCTFEPAYTIEQIVETIKSVTGLTHWVPYVPNSVILPSSAIAKACGSPMGICPERVKKLQISTDISGKKFVNSGYTFNWTLEEAIADWFADNQGKCLE